MAAPSAVKSGEFAVYPSLLCVPSLAVQHDWPDVIADALRTTHAPTLCNAVSGRIPAALSVWLNTYSVAGSTAAGLGSKEEREEESEEYTEQFHSITVTNTRADTTNNANNNNSNMNNNNNSNIISDNINSNNSNINNNGYNGDDAASVSCISLHCDSPSLQCSLQSAREFRVSAPSLALHCTVKAETRTYACHSGEIYSLDISPFNNWIITGGRNGKVKTILTDKSLFAQYTLPKHKIQDEEKKKYSVNNNNNNNNNNNSNNNNNNSGDGNGDMDDDRKIDDEFTRVFPHFAPKPRPNINGDTVEDFNLPSHTNYRCLSSYTAHSGDISLVRFFPSGQVHLTCGADSLIKLYASATLYTNKAVKIFNGHSRPVNSLQMVEKGKNFITASADGTVKIWDCARESAVHSFGGSNNNNSNSNYNNGGGYSKLLVYDMESTENIGVCIENTTRIRSIDIRMANTATNQPFTIENTPQYAFPSCASLVANKSAVEYTCLAVCSASPFFLIMGTSIGSVHILDIRTNACMAAFKKDNLNAAVEFIVEVTGNTYLIANNIGNISLIEINLTNTNNNTSNNNTTNNNNNNNSNNGNSTNNSSSDGTGGIRLLKEYSGLDNEMIYDVAVKRLHPVCNAAAKRIDSHANPVTGFYTASFGVVKEYSI